VTERGEVRRIGERADEAHAAERPTRAAVAARPAQGQRRQWNGQRATITGEARRSTSERASRDGPTSATTDATTDERAGEARRPVSCQGVRARSPVAFARRTVHRNHLVFSQCENCDFFAPHCEGRNRFLLSSLISTPHSIFA
jgi:hypothetical protein